MKLGDCVPKHKQDFEAVKNAASLGYPGINPILPQLLIWIQDCNWPVAKVLAPLLARAGPEIAPHFRAILNSKDSIWKYWVLWALAEDLDQEVWVLIRPDVQRISETPTEDEAMEGVQERAAKLMTLRSSSGDQP